MRRYGWSSGNIGANGHCVLLETEQTQRGSTTSYLRPAQEDLSTDSCGENIRYQAVEGLVQNSRHQMGPKAHLLRSVRLFHATFVMIRLLHTQQSVVWDLCSFKKYVNKCWGDHWKWGQYSSLRKFNRITYFFLRFLGSTNYKYTFVNIYILTIETCT